MTQEALKLALDYLESRGLAWNVQIALREALRENAMREVQRLGQEIEQEPVKYSDYEPDGVHHNKPPQPVQEQEPVAYWKEYAKGLQRDYDSLLADFQAQRTWVDLTDEEIDNINYTSAHMLARAIEARLKKLNT